MSMIKWSFPILCLPYYIIYTMCPESRVIADTFYYLWLNKELGSIGIIVEIVVCEGYGYFTVRVNVNDPVK